MRTLSSDQWQLISPRLDEALEMADEERSAWLCSLRTENPDLACHLEALLREHSVLSEEGFLASSVRLPKPAGLAGQKLGAYTLISQIGHGGMGSVWLAERSDGRFQRRVAIKFLNFSLMGKGGEERFKREGNILAQLTHPNIAELIDAGVGPAGQPYLVLEYVQGGHIDRYCEQHSLGVKARIRLFLEVLAAVARAHRNLVVHRDIKPSNVLVRDDGQVKLLDFGIAKLLAEEGAPAAATLLTAGGTAPMTPEYAAPEQLTGQAITTATDIYALGVLLYVLLTGQHPAGPGPYSPAGLVKAIVETEPISLSEAALAARREESCRGGAPKNTTPEKLRRWLRGDLETIVAKALKKDPSERYPSVTALAEDLQRYLRNEPISARPDTVAYRAAKFLRRNRTALILASLAVGATAAGVLGTVVQARTARAQRDFAIRQLARREAVNEFNEFLLSDAAPSGTLFTVNELLGRAEQALAHQGAADDANRVELMVSIGDQYSTQDDDAKARKVLEEAYKLSWAQPEKSVRAQAACVLAGALARDGELIRAENLYQEGIREIPAEPQYALERTLCLRRGSEVAQESGNAGEGITRMVAAQQILRKSPFDSDVAELRLSMDLAEAYRMAGQNQRAVTSFERSAKLLTSLGRDNTQTAVVVYNDWALALDRLGRPLEAERLYRRAIDISRTGESEEAVSPVVLNNYAKTLAQLGRLPEAADYAERAYAKAQRVDNQLAIYQSLYARASIYLDQHAVPRAAAMMSALEPRLRQSFPSGSYWFAALASLQARLAMEQGDRQKALQLADQSVNLSEAAAKAGEGVDFAPIVLLRRSKIRFEAGQPGDAAADASRAIVLLQGMQPAVSSAYVGRAYLIVGRCLQAQGKSAEARTAFQSAADHLQSTLGPDHPDTRSARQLAELTTVAR